MFFDSDRLCFLILIDCVFDSDRLCFLILIDCVLLTVLMVKFELTTIEDKWPLNNQSYLQSINFT